jgi:hypothetical protein
MSNEEFEILAAKAVKADQAAMDKFMSNEEFEILAAKAVKADQAAMDKLKK